MASQIWLLANLKLFLRWTREKHVLICVSLVTKKTELLLACSGASLVCAFFTASYLKRSGDAHVTGMYVTCGTQLCRDLFIYFTLFMVLFTTQHVFFAWNQIHQCFFYYGVGFFFFFF